MPARLKIAAGLGLVAAVTGVGVGWAIAAGGGESPEVERARSAALAHVGGGRVTDVDRESKGVWEVELVRTDGSEVEVQLDSRYRVVDVDDEGEADEGSDSDD